MFNLRVLAQQFLFLIAILLVLLSHQFNAKAGGSGASPFGQHEETEAPVERSSPASREPANADVIAAPYQHDESDSLTKDPIKNDASEDLRKSVIRRQRDQESPGAGTRGGGQRQAQQRGDQQPQGQQAGTGPVEQTLNPECETLARECDEARNSAGQQCNADSGSSTAGNSGRSGMSTVAAQVDQMSQASSGAGVEICATMGKVSAVANSAVAGLSFMCSNHQSTCVDKCSQLTQRINANQCVTNPSATLAEHLRQSLQQMRETASQNRTECNRMAARASESGEALNRAARSLLTQSQRCIDQQYPGGLDEFCKANPGSPACMNYANNDCSNPQTAATNPTCICAVNPSDQRCSNNIARVNTGGGIDGMGTGGAGLSNSPGIRDEDLKFDDSSSLNLANPNSGPASKVGGKENLLGLQEGGDFAPDSGGGRGFGGDMSDRTRIFRGGGRGAAGAGGWGSGANQARGRMAAGQGYGNPNSPNGIDLRQFLPGGSQDATRGLATVIGPDGMSGAHSNNFTKIKNRYFHQHSRNAFIVGQ